MHLKLIDIVKKKQPNYHHLYEGAFINCLDRIIKEDCKITEVSLQERKRLVFYGMRMMNHQKTDGFSNEQFMDRLHRMEFIKSVISTLTPNEFENIFPIDKDYDGMRYGTKDYFYTKKVLDEMGIDKEIGDYVEEMLWDYTNWDVRHFNVNNLSALSDIRRSEGQKGLMEEFLEGSGVTIYTMVEGEKNKKYLINNDTGEKMEVKKPIPRYLKLIKKNSPS